MTSKTDKVRAALEELIEFYDHYGQYKDKNAARYKDALSELDGCVLVPMEPTREMIKSAWTAQYLNIGADMAMAENLAEIRVNDTKQKSQDQLAYEAMIAPYVGEKK